jgi:cytochrome c oxidase assembly protein subunit 15
VKNPTVEKPLPALAWWAFWLVQLQGLLGGLRVVLDAYVIAGTKLGVVFGLIHGCLAQGFFALLCVIALFTSKWWNGKVGSPLPAEGAHGVTHPTIHNFAKLALFTTALISLQLILGATMRHQHAGLAISDFPLAHGKLWPDMSASAVASYNAQRMEIGGENLITSAHIGLQMAHRVGAVLILGAVSVCAWRARGVLQRPALLWLALILVQATLGAFTIWKNKAADLATLHVVVGALSLVTGVLLTIIAFRFSALPGKK